MLSILQGEVSIEYVTLALGGGRLNGCNIIVTQTTHPSNNI